MRGGPQREGGKVGMRCPPAWQEELKTAYLCVEVYDMWSENLDDLNVSSVLCIILKKVLWEIFSIHLSVHFLLLICDQATEAAVSANMSRPSFSSHFLQF